MSNAIRDGEEIEIEAGGQRWIQSWHSSAAAPAGKPHGSAGICVTGTGEVVLISADGQTWDFPAGRPEGNETWEQTLRREMMEEACAVITEARLLGFARGRCIRGHEAGLVLVRSFWHAKVELLEWNPQFEIRHRRLAIPQDATPHLPDAYEPIWRRALQEAGLI